MQIKITELPPEADWYQVLRIEGIGASARSSGVVLLKRACAAHLGKSPGPRTEQGKATLKHGNTPKKHSQHPTLGWGVDCAVTRKQGWGLSPLDTRTIREALS